MIEHIYGDAAAKPILIVDDDPINRMVLKKIFSQYYHVEEAANGYEGLKKLRDPNSNYCAVLMDIMMPVMTGIEVVRWMNSTGLVDKLPVFLITSESGESVMREAYELGVMDVISKPVVSFVVLRRVRSVIELFETRQHLSSVVAIQSAELLRQATKIIELNRGMIEALATAIEFRNEESGGHVQRICTITRILLEKTDFGEGLQPEELDNIATASIMHDVGKITIPDAVLTKPGKLTADEYEIMKQHTVNGVKLLESIPQLRESGVYRYACDIARHHHERWDGRGYPDGLAGNDISPWAQVVSMADVYDALSCRRIYKAAFPRAQVVEMIREGQCGKFNPHLIDSFMSVEQEIHELYEELPEAM